ncbi:alpha/beta hydrolase [Polynucleobacter sp. IMCC30063]|uniref:alpha/beta hydrolase n=1 Tax=Polynucleobacter sp. IMCC30063 TaxID=2907298 RepID=UPI001F38FC2F|nr:alpha/beta hydrolase [Polynucleobacter sp. IMCC30063]MCE7504745.1 alpha/beta hydrolase [Polynucleobacter sp. IMCC30063]
MNRRTQVITIPGLVGSIQIAVDIPEAVIRTSNFMVRGLALIAHPHPLMGGTMDNKVAQTVARTFNQLGYVAVRPNFRGVGESAGVHDAGNGEIDDLYLLTQWMRQAVSWQPLGLEIGQIEQLPLALAGFSFGSFVCSHLLKRLVQEGQAVERLVMIGSAAGKWEMAPVPASTILIHGELDETIPLQAVFEWARPQELVVQVVPGADHFFHRRLHCIRNIILGEWLGQAAWTQ